MSYLAQFAQLLTNAPTGPSSQSYPTSHSPTSPTSSTSSLASSSFPACVLTSSTSSSVHIGAASSKNPSSATPSPGHHDRSSNQPTSKVNSGAIAGGVVGAFIFLCLVAVGALCIIRRRRKSRQPPSAEFMHIARGQSELGFVPTDGKTTPSLARLIPLARQSSLEDDERPPAFTPGSYGDPVLEKVQASAELREKYGGTSEEGGHQ
ncbi:hypothetical protein DICSQDRAFT_169997 [Dichomitus squalens LYAD-421 SS1]|uniref:Uncharacterized protein n=2 Tax=Dichomitus squalens TaxID=114155 RepID=A0A4Q9MMS1_9APHY|nr:uncharacterized protein DICSQDRAFT_169997 [Dichomitus squalens LYAD-421 SS1]EJF61581.1 hypothetical protein DICSQDRAFT_169997 [Dichomitus squalens LYAD-421 SS1]TBU28188.1 hypothetical protein BD311DRAFT_336290 [Dichomitus squalens]